MAKQHIQALCWPREQSVCLFSPLYRLGILRLVFTSQMTGTYGNEWVCIGERGEGSSQLVKHQAVYSSGNSIARYKIAVCRPV